MTDYNKPVRMKQGLIDYLDLMPIGQLNLGKIKLRRINRNKKFRKRNLDDHLYQRFPKPRETYRVFKGKKSWTSSLESYRNIARQHKYCLTRNQRQPNHIVTINITQNYFVPDVQKLKDTLQIIFQYLRRYKKIVAYITLEVTKDSYKRNPIDQVHLHFLIDTQLTKTDLTEHLKDAMNATGVRYALSKHDHITDENRNAIYDYVTGFGGGYDWTEEPDEASTKKPKKKPILFKEGLRLQKVYQVGKFWLDADGQPTNITKLWEPIRQRTLQKYESKTFPPIVEQPTSPIGCPHSDDSDYEYCGQYQDCGQYPECRLPPPTLSTLPEPPIVEQPNETKKSPPVEKPAFPPHSTDRYIAKRFIRDF